MILHRTNSDQKGKTLCGVGTKTANFKVNVKRRIEDHTVSAHAVNCRDCLAKMFPWNPAYR